MTTIVVGAGPAGLIAAISLSHAGEHVTLVDEQMSPGGHLRYDPYGPTADPDPSWRAELLSGLAASAVTLRSQTVAWAAYRAASGFEVMLSAPTGPDSIAADNLILATGTTDRELNVAGSTLPGVMTERAARILIEVHGVIPGARYVIAGADQIRTGRLLACLEREGVEAVVLAPSLISEIGGAGGVEYVVTSEGKRIPADIVVIADGERPDVQLAGMLEVPRVFSLAVDGWMVSTSDCGPGLHVIGGALYGSGGARDQVFSAANVTSAIVNGAGIPDGLPRSRSLVLSAGAPQ